MTIETSPLDGESRQLVPLGVFARPQGLGGELRVHLYNSHSTALAETDTLQVELPTGEKKTLELLGIRTQGSKTLVRIEGVRSREDAEALKGAQILVPRGDLPTLADDEFYDIDLVGLSVCSTDETEIGVVEAVEHPPANDVLTIRLKDGEYTDLPMIEEFVTRIDMTAKVVVVELPSDLPRRKSR